MISIFCKHIDMYHIHDEERVYDWLCRAKFNDIRKSGCDRIWSINLWISSRLFPSTVEDLRVEGYDLSMSDI